MKSSPINALNCVMGENTNNAAADAPQLQEMQFRVFICVFAK